MRIMLVTAGSRGDVEPFAVLARRAVAAGHEVHLVIPDRSGADVGGLDVVSLGVDYTRMIEQQGVSLGAALRSYRSVVQPVMRGVIVGAARAALDVRPDLLVAHPKVLSAPLIAGALDIPYAWVEMVPVMTPTRAFPAAGAVSWDLGPLNPLTYRAAAGGAALFRRDLRDAGELLGLRSSVPAPADAMLMPISPQLLMRPVDWPDTVHLTGPWRSASTAELPDDVAAFLAEGDVVYAGFGSMAAGDPVTRAREVIRGIRATGARALVATGLGGLMVPPDLLGDDVLVTASVAHDRVLPATVAAIHHGGIGTLQAATAAGTPSVVVPFIADQPFWGARAYEQGLAPRPIPRRELTATRLMAALGRAPELRLAVGQAAAAMRTEDGAAAALAVLGSLVH